MPSSRQAHAPSVSRRSWPEITIDILTVTMRPSNKMRIMYKSNLNFQRFNRYFYDLLRKDFIREINSSERGSVYEITERGRNFLDVLRKAESLFLSEEY